MMDKSGTMMINGDAFGHALDFFIAMSFHPDHVHHDHLALWCGIGFGIGPDHELVPLNLWAWGDSCRWVTASPAGYGHG